MEAPKNIDSGATFRIRVDDASAMEFVSATKSGAMTHARNSDGRFLKLDFEVVDANTIEVNTPGANVMVPGLWMLTTVDGQGVPSTASLMGVDMAPLVDTPALEASTPVYNIENEQIDGAFQLTVEARYDDLDAGAYQRVFDFGNGAGKDNIWLGQLGTTGDMAFEIIREGKKHRITVADAITEGEIATWKVSVDANGLMQLYKNGALIAEGQGIVPADVERINNFVGSSNWAADSWLRGMVRNLAIDNDTGIHDIEDEQIDGPFELTVEARFDDLDAGAYQRVVDFGNGAGKDNIWLGQFGTTGDMAFEIIREGKKHRITAADAITEGEAATWKVSVDADGLMQLYKNGTLVAEGQGVVPADVERSRNLVGSSNWAGDADLRGMVRNLVIDNKATLEVGTVEDEQIDGPFELTVEARYDDLDAGAYQRVFDFGNGAGKDNIWLGQDGKSDDMAFEIIRDGTKHRITAADAITEGEAATWKVSVNADGLMQLYKNGTLVAEGQGVVPADVTRDSNLVGRSNWAADAELRGMVRNVAITNIEAPAVNIIETGDNGGYFTGTTDNDEFRGGAGTDTFHGGGGDDTYDGAGGYNQVDFDGYREDYRITRNADGTVSFEHPVHGTDLLKNIDGIWFRDEAKWYALEDLAREPIPAGINIVDAGDSGGYFNGTRGDDDFRGGEGIDIFRGGEGDDVYDGAGGSYNQVDLDGARHDYTISRNDDGTVSFEHPAHGTDLMKNIDGVWFAGEARWYAMDDLAPSPVPDGVNVIEAGDNGGYFEGTAGNDEFRGGAGVDVFHGGAGDDVYDGGGAYNQVNLDGNRADYAFTANADGTLTASHVEYGQDVLKDIDGVWFGGDDQWVASDDLAGAA
ncbi:LamG-like jellyroll fold domain-containing protein [Roseibium salinum]|uniref:LamG-like jellyroll fold domain-containing protein n=1 Tax=Roseibium salinum TaxID=1604349 RepID=UPI00361AA776